MSTPIFLDIETIPGQDEHVIGHFKAKAFDEVDAELKAVDAKIEGIQAPSTYKDAAKIEAYVNEKRAALEAERNTLLHSIPERFDAAWRKTSLDGAFGNIFCVSIAIGDGLPFSIVNEDWTSPSGEAGLLLKLDRELRDIQIETKHRGFLVGHHIIGFDRKFIRQRGIVRRVQLPSIITDPVKPWERGVVFDTMAAWSDDPRDRISMNKLCLALGLEGKGGDLDDGEDIDGAKVWDFVKAGQGDKVVTYCEGDVIRTRNIFNRINGVFQ
ncbi:Predicted 3'-5' exonuclease, PolB-like [uncultured Caudovirales phage]|uniref:Predicted 3'-5' exonuclease, PolB-like n=1 Tax=uncultured Caudovirales phage TaxID=2100421 RepID=A0A6J5NHN5_9CAUD|nr:Predicted 3'-5' exonuclease, PolB-like [uncultured Caudovirales phage]